MTFELEADGVHFRCTSPSVTLKLVEKGARLLDEAQAQHLRLALETPSLAEGPAVGGPRRPR
jgi:hypothetical protein